MKIAFLMLTVVAIYCNVSCMAQKHHNLKDADQFDFSLLVGDWKRSNDSNGKQTYESWHIDSRNMAKGFGYTMSSQDTIWKENISIEKYNGVLSFVVTDGSNHVTPFAVTHQTLTGFTCSNPDNEFPKEIKYIIVDNDKLKATISGGGNHIDFLFDRMDSQPH